MKVFCIGANKTGTTSLYHEFVRLGYNVPKQEDFERLFPIYKEGKYEEIADMCQEHDFFQDIPFSLPNLYKTLHKKYPDAKFILSVRNSEDEWYQSTIRWHKQLFRGKLPSVSQLKSWTIQNFSVWDLHQKIYGVTEDDPYNEEKFKSFYRKHNEDVIRYFLGNPNFLILNLSSQYAYQNFQNFLGIRTRFIKFLHSNKTRK